MRRIGCKQVVDYMKKEGWYGLYCDNLLYELSHYDYEGNKKIKQHYLRKLFCYNGANAVSSNLIWSSTSEGYDYWRNRSVDLEITFSHKRLKYKEL